MLSCVWLFVTPWTAARQASLSFTNSWSLLKLCPLSWWCHPTISSSVVPFSSCLQSFPALVSFPVSQFFTICDNFGAQENKVYHCFHCFPIYLPWSDETGCHDLSFLNVEFSPFYSWANWGAVEVPSVMFWGKPGLPLQSRDSKFPGFQRISVFFLSYLPPSHPPNHITKKGNRKAGHPWSH